MNKGNKHTEAKKIAMKDITEDSEVNYVYMEKRIINNCGNNCKECKCKK